LHDGSPCLRERKRIAKLSRGIKEGVAFLKKSSAKDFFVAFTRGVATFPGSKSGAADT
jgi:hypothetical protein